LYYLCITKHQEFKKKVFKPKLFLYSIETLKKKILHIPNYYPPHIGGIEVFLAIICVYVVSDFKKIAVFTVIALNWCLFTFAFSYGNALADQARYSEFRITLLLHDLSALFPNRSKGDMNFQLPYHPKRRKSRFNHIETLK